MYPVIISSFFFSSSLKKGVEENGIDFNMFCFFAGFSVFFSKERTAAVFWTVVFSPEEIRRDFWGTNRCSGNMLVGSSKSTSFQHQSRDRKLALGKLPCYFFWCSDLLSLIVGLGWVVLNFRCSFFQKQRLYFFLVQWWFSTHQHEHSRRKSGALMLRLLFKWSKPGCGLQIARMVGWCTTFSSDLWPRRLAGFGKKETYEQLIFLKLTR